MSTQRDGRIEVQYGRAILCGVILCKDDIEPGQVWQGSSGTTVTVQAVDSDGWVTYGWAEGDAPRTHTKDSFAFQCRYCLVI